MKSDLLQIQADLNIVQREAEKPDSHGQGAKVSWDALQRARTKIDDLIAGIEGGYEGLDDEDDFEDEYQDECAGCY
jgi:hypothetical protein